jgi:queuine tRNA-ribosyltransferase
MRLDFKVEARAEGSQARAARFRTLHNEVLTPLFMPVGTQATVKAQLTSMLEDTGSQILLANTYHLLLRPGPEIFEKMGGIHPFMSWKRSVLTDSGGFQIFSLPNSRQMSEEGASFESYVDGRKILLSPEKSIATQRAIGSDIMMALDQCIPSTADRAQAREALGITHRWAKRSLDARGDSPQSLFGIVQGALFHDLRKESAETLCEMPFDGFAIGGLAVGEGKAEREDTCEFTARLLPEDRPRYLMGVGTPLDLLEAVHRGVDMFDCVLPTKLGGRGGAYTSRGHVNLRRGIYRTMDAPLDASCSCLTCSRYSRAYLAHLTRTQEVLGWTLIGHHNIHFYHQLMREIRASILEGRFLELYREKREYLQADDLDYPIHGPRINPSKRTKQPALALGAYEVIQSAPRADGGASHASIRHRESGEIMHSRTAPELEARRLYIDQSRLAERLRVPTHAEVDPTLTPLVVWDVGLGAAANAMAAIRCYEDQASQFPGHELRPMRLISFENDLDSLKLAFAHSDQFTYLRHSAPAAILKEGRWQSKTLPGLSWGLVPGDFFERIAASPQSEEIPAPDLVFYDMFSFKTQARDWTRQAFARLFDRCAPKACELFTYSASTGVRVALLAAGFHVAKGLSTGDKSETTIALTPLAARMPRLVGDPTWLGSLDRELLGAEWLDRWSRSHAKFPSDLPDEERVAFESVILGHSQFVPLRTASGQAPQAGSEASSLRS